MSLQNFDISPKDFRTVFKNHRCPVTLIVSSGYLVGKQSIILLSLLIRYALE